MFISPRIVTAFLLASTAICAKDRSSAHSRTFKSLKSKNLVTAPIFLTHLFDSFRIFLS